MRLLKKHAIIIVITCLLIAFSISIAFIYNEINDYALKITDVSGDRSQLEDIIISGVIADELHRREFVIADNIITTNFKASSQSHLSKLIPRFDSMLNYYYEISDDAKIIETEEKKNDNTTIRIRANKADLYYEIRTGKATYIFKTDVIYSSDEMGFRTSYHYRNNRLTGSSGWSMDALTGIFDNKVRYNGEGRAFIYTNTGLDNSGFGGAYEVTTFIDKDNKKKYPQNTNPVEIDLENIAPIDLKGGSIRIHGMEVIDNILVFITAENDEIILKIFDLTTKQFLDDINLGYHQNLNSHNKYYADITDNYLLLAFKLKDIRCKFVVYDAQQNHIIQNLNETNIDQVQTSLADIIMSYKNNKLFILRSFVTFASIEIIYGYSIGTPDAKITVYGDELLYEGNLQSNINDDYSFQVEGDNFSNRLYYRNYYNLSLE